MLSFEKKKVALKDEEIAYLDIGEGKPVLFIHGNFSSSVHYLPLIENLKDRYRCIALDLRGFGDSTYNHSFSSFYELAEDVVQFLDALGLDKLPVICWSAGGGTALTLAATHPDRVEKIFMLEAASHMGYPVYKKNADGSMRYGEAYESKEALSQDPIQVIPLLTAVATHNAAMMTQIWNATIYTVNKPSKEDNDIFIEETLKQRCLVDLDWSLASLNMSHVFTPYGKGDGNIDKVTCPITLTSADHDLTVPDWMVMQNKNALPQSKLVLFKNSGHSPVVDCLDDLTKEVEEFLK